jgi:hypothetical protein
MTTTPTDPSGEESAERSGGDPPLPVARWGWTGELPPDELRTVALVSFELWRRGHQWVDRRVQTIELLDVESVRQRLSIDFRIPTELPGDVTLAGRRTFFLPIAILPRRSSLAYFDLRDESGQAIPMLTRQENARLTGAMLITAASRAIGSAPRPPDVPPLQLSDALVTYLASIPTKTAGASRPFVQPVLDPVNALLYPDPAVGDELLRDEDFRDLLGICASCSFIHVPLPAERGERRIIKLSFSSPWDSRLPDRKRTWSERRRAMTTWLGWRSETRYLSLPQVGNAESFHAQVGAPERVEFTEAGMRNRRPADLVRPLAADAPDLPDSPGEALNDRRGYQQFSPGIDAQKHVYVEASHAHRAGFIWVRFRVARHGFLRAVAAVAALTTLLLALFALNGENVVGESQTAAALLLLVPALIAGFLIAPGEHAMTRHLLRGPRLLTAATGALALIAIAGLLALPESKPHPKVPGSLLCLWWIEVGLGLAITVLLTLANFLPRAGSREDVSAPAAAEQPFTEPEPEGGAQGG